MGSVHRATGRPDEIRLGPIALPTNYTPIISYLYSSLHKAADDLAEKLVAVEGNLLQLKLTGRGQDDCRWSPMLLNKIAYLSNQLDSTADFPPTTQQVAVQEMLKQQGDKAVQEFQQVLAKDVAAFNAMLRERNIPNLFVRTP